MILTERGVETENCRQQHNYKNSGLICAYQDKILIVTDYLYVFDYDSGNQSHKSSNSLQDDDRMEYVRPKINSTKATFIVEGNLLIFILIPTNLLAMICMI